MKWMRANLKAIKFRNLIACVNRESCHLSDFQSSTVYYFHNKCIPPYKTDTYLFVALKVSFLQKKTASSWLDCFLIIFVARINLFLVHIYTSFLPMENCSTFSAFRSINWSPVSSAISPCSSINFALIGFYGRLGLLTSPTRRRGRKREREESKPRRGTRRIFIRRAFTPKGRRAIGTYRNLYRWPKRTSVLKRWPKLPGHREWNFIRQ